MDTQLMLLDEPTSELDHASIEKVLKIIRDLKNQRKTICGLSNISYGLPNRKLLNQAFSVLCMANGMDSVILDPLDKTMMSLLIASKTLLGRGDYCVEYLAAYREGGQIS